MACGGNFPKFWTGYLTFKPQNPSFRPVKKTVEFWHILRRGEGLEGAHTY
jgi:hypothetical protein